MTIEEKLEALTQTLELTVHQGQDTERRLNAVAVRLEKLTGFVNDIADGTARLLNIAQIHEQRISKLEGGD